MWMVLLLATVISLGGLALLISCEETDEYPPTKGKPSGKHS
jgi:hypothetical protein